MAALACPRPRTGLAIASVVVVTVAALALGPVTANDDAVVDNIVVTHTAVTNSAATGVSWARTASGVIVEVVPTHFATPLHPEALTHPDADGMSGQGAGLALAANVSPNPISPDSSIPRLPGIDVSSNQGAINWASVAPHVDFVYAKATEGTYYRNVDFANQYNGPYDHGVIRGAYHFAVPSNSSGTVQADYFVAHGGGWSADGRTLPGALDIEYNPYGATCYGLTTGQMVGWLKNFITEYAAREHVFPVIYSSTDWWRACTGNYGGFAKEDPFWVANYSTTGGTLPAGWGFYTFWQYSDKGSQPGDQDVFNGAYSQLKILAVNG